MKITYTLARIQKLCRKYKYEMFGSLTSYLHKVSEGGIIRWHLVKADVCRKVVNLKTFDTFKRYSGLSDEGVKSKRWKRRKTFPDWGSCCRCTLRLLLPPRAFSFLHPTSPFFLKHIFVLKLFLCYGKRTHFKAKWGQSLGPWLFAQELMPWNWYWCMR